MSYLGEYLQEGSLNIKCSVIQYAAHWAQYSVKGKGFPYSLPSVGPGADPGVQAVSPQVT